MVTARFVVCIDCAMRVCDLHRGHRRDDSRDDALDRDRDLRTARSPAALPVHEHVPGHRARGSDSQRFRDERRRAVARDRRRASRRTPTSPFAESESRRKRRAHLRRECAESLSWLTGMTAARAPTSPHATRSRAGSVAGIPDVQRLGTSRRRRRRDASEQLDRCRRARCWSDAWRPCIAWRMRLRRQRSAPRAMSLSMATESVTASTVVPWPSLACTSECARIMMSMRDVIVVSTECDVARADHLRLLLEPRVQRVADARLDAQQHGLRLRRRRDAPARSAAATANARAEPARRRLRIRTGSSSGSDAKRRARGRPARARRARSARNCAVKNALHVGGRVRERRVARAEHLVVARTGRSRPAPSRA